MNNSMRGKLEVLFLSAALLSVGIAGRILAADGPKDWEITNAVDDELMQDPATPDNFIDVSTTDGIVTLTGSVPNILAKERAEEVAATVKGVRGVVNRLDVNAPRRSDTEIKEDVQNALMWDPATASWKLSVSVDNGVVTLNGTVDSWQETQLAKRVAESVVGVKGVNNDLFINYKIKRGDSEIKTEINDVLRWDAFVDNALIDVSVNKGKVSLTGDVGSFAEKIAAGRDAWVTGVSNVRNDLNVKWWARDARHREDKYVYRTDKEIDGAVRDAMLYDPRVASFDVKVQSDDGYVTLRGVVDNLMAKRSATQDARGVVGVWAVKNNIKVRPISANDKTIERNVESALGRDPYVDRYQFTVTVDNGDVSLYGAVDTNFEKAEADNVTARQAGVQVVNNFLTVNKQNIAMYNPYAGDWYFYDYDWYTTPRRVATKSDQEIKADIQNELFWSPYLDRGRVNVDVEKGVAHLTGTVQTLAEKQAATQKALEGGAVAVENSLIVERGPEFLSGR
jgi:osmotically-inducible protein OsmY